jgi:hypothetical protein
MYLCMHAYICTHLFVFVCFYTHTRTHAQEHKAWKIAHVLRIHTSVSPCPRVAMGARTSEGLRTIRALGARLIPIPVGIFCLQAGISVHLSPNVHVCTVFSCAHVHARKHAWTHIHFIFAFMHIFIRMFTFLNEGKGFRFVNLHLFGPLAALRANVGNIRCTRIDGKPYGHPFVRHSLACTSMCALADLHLIGMQ